jgi:soluble lytic murein transglycosylase-like protein
MVIQGRFPLALGAFFLVIASGAITASAADSIGPLARRAEVAVAPPERHDVVRVDLSLERGLDADGSSVQSNPSRPAGSSMQAVSSTPAASAPTTDADPWAEALAESSRLGSVLVWADSPAYPIVLNPEVKFFLERFTGDRRSIVGMWLNRANRYLVMIRQVLRDRGLPEDLAFTAMIESGFNPVAVSRAGAAGLWQFMAATARRYGLRVDQWVDERMDPEKSTLAAASYFRDLYQQFGSWVLAQAAYNAGEVKVTKAIRATGSTDFWHLARTRWLQRETKDFVPQIQAATMIGRDPSQYGFEPRDMSPILVESVPVPPHTDLKRLSATSGLRMETLRELNPTLVRGVTPPGTVYRLRVPVGSGNGVLAAIDTVNNPAIGRPPVNMGRAGGHADMHVVRPRDTVSSIAQRYGVSIGDVLRWNSLERHDAIRPGDRLRVIDRRLSPERDRQASPR